VLKKTPLRRGFFIGGGEKVMVDRYLAGLYGVEVKKVE
jgi:hypothetical protein